MGGSDNTKNKIPINNFQEMCKVVASRHETLQNQRSEEVLFEIMKIWKTNEPQLR